MSKLSTVLSISQVQVLAADSFSSNGNDNEVTAVPTNGRGVLAIRLSPVSSYT